MAALRESPAVTVATETSTLAVYMRVSSEEQREQGTIQTQQGAAERYLALQDIRPYGWYGDDGVSGTVPFDKRPEGRRLLEDAEAGHVRTVLCYRLDRIGRNALAVLQAVEALEQLGVRLVSITESFDTSTPAGRLQLNMLATIAQFERDSIVQRTSEGKGRRLHAGGWMGGPAPYGYILVGKDKDAQLIVDEQTAENVRAMFGWLMGERMGCHRIACRLNALGVAPRNGGACWRANSVHVVLTNPAYAGRIRHGGEVVAGTHQPIVPPHVFDAAQRALEANTSHTRRETAQPFLLRGLVRCAHCGCIYRGTTFTKGQRREGEAPNTYRAYVCNGKHMGRQRAGTRHLAPDERCPSASIRADRLESYVWADVEQYVRHPDETLALLRARLSGQTDQQDALRADMAAIARQLEAQQAEKDKVIALYRKSLIGERDVERQYAELDREAARLQAEHDKLAARAAESAEVAAKLVTAEETLTRLRERLDVEGDNPRVRRELVEDLVASISVAAEVVGVARSGRRRLRSLVTVVYCFADPETSHSDTDTPGPG
jgi:site-specific DNA recombinase